jgi:hypothetical protein
MRGSVAPPGFTPGVTSAASDGGSTVAPEAGISPPGWTAEALSRGAGPEETR